MNNFLRVLLVDDDEDEYILTQSLLSDRPHGSGEFEPVSIRLDWVATYEAALQAFEQDRYDIYLVDYQLGERDGIELLRTVRRNGSHAPIIVLTGQGSYSVDLEAMRAGATDYLSKREVTGPLLERTIRYALDRQRTEDALRRAQDELEMRVQERTRELAYANAELRAEIIERKRVETALEAERQRLFSLLEVLPAYVCLQGPDYSIHYANCRFSEIFGDPQGKACYEVIHKRSEPCPVCYTQQVFENHTPVEFEFTLLSGKSYQIYDYPFVDVDGSPLVMELGIDITARKQVEALLEHNNCELLELSQAERKQRQMAEALAQATIALSTSLDLDEVLDRILEQIQCVISCRSTAIMMLEDENVQVTRSRGFESIPGIEAFLENSFSIDLLPVLKKIQSTAQPVVIPDTRSNPDWINDPKFDWVRSCAGLPLRIGSRVVGFLCILSEDEDFFSQEIVHYLKAFAAHAGVSIQNAHLYRDLESALEQEQAIRTQLIHAEKFAAMGRMVASVAHELNNPLQTIKNCLFLTQQETPPDSPFQDYLNMAYSETQRLTNLVTQLRELYRPQSATIMQPLSLAEVLKEVRRLLAPQLQQQNVVWQQSNESQFDYILGALDQLKQVFINICSNAIEAMQPAGGRLFVTLINALDPPQVGVVFEDTGPGISPENMTKLFEPFFTTKNHGLGLGLSISYEIVERHGGRIKVTSRPGHGASFVVWLPLVWQAEMLPG